MGVWIQLLRIQQIEKAGVSRTYHPGDWVEVGRQTAQRWIIDGVARTATPKAIQSNLAGCGVVISGSRAAVTRLTARMTDLRHEYSDDLPFSFSRTLFWQTGFSIRAELVSVGFDLLSRWEVAAPLVSYDELACHVGTPEARSRTAEMIHDLRVPLYEPRFLFVRRCRAGISLLKAYKTERLTGDDDRLCLLRALYSVKPLVCALPVTWNHKVKAIA